MEWEHNIPWISLQLWSCYFKIKELHDVKLLHSTLCEHGCVLKVSHKLNFNRRFRALSRDKSSGINKTFLRVCLESSNLHWDHKTQRSISWVQFWLRVKLEAFFPTNNPDNALWKPESHSPFNPEADLLELHGLWQIWHQLKDYNWLLCLPVTFIIR